MSKKARIRHNEFTWYQKIPASKTSHMAVEIMKMNAVDELPKAKYVKTACGVTLRNPVIPKAKIKINKCKRCIAGLVTDRIIGGASDISI